MKMINRAERLPLVVDVKRGVTEDGPGIRTTVFFKGCPLACKWCQNPEAVDPLVEIGFYPQKCIVCGECADVCPEGAIQMEAGERIDRSKCNRCGLCADACPAKALRTIGKHYEIDDLVQILLRDRTFYEVSGGGVTLSGGEPALWTGYVGNLLKTLKSEGVHTAMQTCGHFEFLAFKKDVLPWIDLIMYDLKIIDPDDHLRHTGKDNKTILGNFRRLLDEDVEILPRIPMIPGFTSSDDNLARISSFLKECRINDYYPLPYNPLGNSKWRNLGKIQPVAGQTERV